MGTIMGSDQHGEAYPEPPPPPYRCPICGGGANRYMTCEYPGCPDGHDQPARGPFYPPANRRTLAEEIIDPTDPPLWQRLIVFGLVCIALFYLFSTPG
jgi:hypothetical protein